MNEENGESIPTASPVPAGAIQSGVPMAQPVGPPLPRIGNALVGWVVVSALVGAGVYFQNFVRPEMAEKADRKEAKEETVAAKPVLLEIQMRMLVGVYHAAMADKEEDEAAKTKARESITTQVAALNRGSIDQRLRVIVALGEIAGYDEAQKTLVKLQELIKEHGTELSKADAERLDVLARLYQDYADSRPEAPTVSPDERAELPARLGWFGELALGNPDSPLDDSKRLRSAALETAERSKNALWMFVIVVSSAFGVGMLSLTFLAIAYVWRRGSAHPMRTALGPPVPHHAVYVETFAVAGLLFAGLNAAAREIPVRSMMEMLYLQGGAMLLTLSALAWPVLRGVAWRQVRKDIGLNFGRLPLLEPSFGVLTYCMALPFTLVGLSCTLVLLLLQAAGVFTLLFGGALGRPAAAGGAPNPFASDPSISHPIIEFLAYGSARELIAILVLAAIVAPIVEETFFRGVLYRHLRDATRSLGLFGLIVSALVVNAIFAIIHPQGLLVAPALAALACGFVVGREWRGTLIPSMLAHGINNAIMVTLIYSLLH
jgi:membrane protease YdiL (CAAX protease family)